MTARVALVALNGLRCLGWRIWEDEGGLKVLDEGGAPPPSGSDIEGMVQRNAPAMLALLHQETQEIVEAASR